MPGEVTVPEVPQTYCDMPTRYPVADHEPQPDTHCQTLTHCAYEHMTSSLQAHMATSASSTHVQDATPDSKRLSSKSAFQTTL